MNAAYHFRFHISILSLIMFLSSSLHAETIPAAIDIYSMAKDANFIFKGRVIDVQYRNSESVRVTDPCGNPVYEDGQPVLLDGSNLPHSFVKYDIERIYKGKPPAGSPPSPPYLPLTLRFVGGADLQKPGEIVWVSHYPHMDVNDRDILFVKNNTVRPCPLVDSDEGRFRAIRPGPTGVPMIFNDMGHQVLLVDNPSPELDEADLGPYQHLPDVVTHSFGGCSDCKLVETTIEEPLNEFSLPGQDGGEPEAGVPRGAQFTESQFDSFVDYVVAQMHTPSELYNLPPVVSADINQPFYAAAYTEDAPTDYGPEEPPVADSRPWLDLLPAAQRNAILEAEREEGRLFELSEGNPVLPSTPCEMRILTEGAIAGDISGPMGRPDCYVNLYDMASIAQTWLNCIDPENAACGLF